MPHKNRTGPQTTECALGIIDDEGKYFGLSDPDYTHTSDMSGGAKYKITGFVKQHLDSKYDTVGTIEIQTATKL